jgi:arsenite-transporting ATPase
VIVNNVLPAGGPCPVCDRRRVAERRVIAATWRRFGRAHVLRMVPAQITEPRGVRAVARLRTAPLRAAGAGKTMKPGIGGAAFSVPALSKVDGAGALARTIGRASLVFVGGKGGVGKTTVSAASAIRLARGDARRRVLLLSTDPAHSLADVLKAAVDDVPRAAAGAPRNLHVRELDAARAFAERRQQVEAALDEIASAFGADREAASSSSGVRVQAPAAAASELIHLAPPGIDELFGVLSVVDARQAYDVIVVDTAPTGHALRLLETPEAAREWTQVLLRMLLKYKSLVRPGRLAAELVDLSKSIRDLQALLRDPSQTRFIVVTRAADVPLRETARLVRRLRTLHLATPAVVVNALTLSPGRCAWCCAAAAAESRELAAVRRLCARRCAIIQTPLAAPAPRGAAALERWADVWLD